MKMFITMFVLVAGVTAQSAINQKATSSDCNERVSGTLLQNTTFVEPKDKQAPKPVDTQIASKKGNTQGS